MTYDWIPSMQLGPLKFGLEIDDLVERGIVLPLEFDDESTGWDTYTYRGDSTRVHVEDGRIISVGCYEQCILRGENLIGMPFNRACAVIGYLPSGVPDTILIDDFPQQVFEFDDVGAQVWVKDGTIVTIFCSSA